MKTTFVQRLVFAILALFLLAYVGFQIYRANSANYKTETANLYSVAESTKVNGIMLRQELLLDDYITSGVTTYVVSDGAKVSPGMAIAEVYNNELDIANIRALRELDNRKQLLLKAQDPGTTAYAHADVLNRQIFSELGGIIDAVNDESLAEIKGISDRLLVVMNTKQIATGKQENFNTTIEQLDREQVYYQEQITEEPRVITAPRPGYFIRAIDGFEDRFIATKPKESDKAEDKATDGTEGEIADEIADEVQQNDDLIALDSLDELQATQILELMNTPPKAASSKRAGKLMTNHIWHFAATVPVDKSGQFRAGAQVSLDFGVSGLGTVPATIKYVNIEKDSENAAIIFESDYINEMLVNLRIEQADVRFRSISGLRVSSEAIRYNGIQKGVYILLGKQLVFRPITVVHEDVGFVLCREEDPAYMKGTTYTGLQLFDEVVIGGTQFTNGWLL